MMNDKIKAIMMKFSSADLRSFLGENLIEQYQLEWCESKTLTKGLLCDMILKLNGISILNNSNFRRKIISHMDRGDIEHCFSYVPISKRKGIIDDQEKSEIIFTSPWKESELTSALLKCLAIQEKFFYDDKTEYQSLEVAYNQVPFYELLDYQYIIKQRVLHILEQPYELKRMLVHMPTGTGKTKTMMHTITNYINLSLKKKGLVIWIAHTTELLDQAYTTFMNVWSHLGIGKINVYKFWSKYDLNDDISEYNGVMFCGIGKLDSCLKSNKKLFDIITQSARLIVFDEAHKAAATETRNMVESLMIKKDGMVDRSLIGLTATPGRTTLDTNDNTLLSQMFEQRLITIDIDTVDRVNYPLHEYHNMKKEENIIKYFQNEHILSKIKCERLQYEYVFSEEEIQKIKIQINENGYTDFSKKTLEMIGSNQSRNKAILQKLRELAINGIPTIVFACSVEHAKLISFMLSLDDIPNAIVIGEMNASDRMNSINSFKDRNDPINILINYEVLTTGFDSTNIQCVFITRPTKSIVLYSQMIGRGLRGPKMGGNEECVLIDIKDNLDNFEIDNAFNHFDLYWSNN